MHFMGFPRPVSTFLYFILILWSFSIAPNFSLSATITLKWDAASPSPEGYHIYQRTEGGNYDYTNPVWSGSSTTCALSNFDDNTTYYFIARSYIGTNVSSNSNEVTFINTVSSSTDDSSSNTDSTTDTSTSDTDSTDASSSNESADSIIIDNGESGSSSIGSWYTSNGTDAYGTESLFSSRIGATYTFSSDISGGYNIDVWWTARTSRCTTVPIKIYDGSVLLETVYADQTQDAGQWNYLGIYEFSDKARVVIESESTACTTCADAIQFTKSSDTAAIGSDSSTETDSTDASSSGDTDSTDSSSSNESADFIIIDNGESGSSSIGSWYTSNGTDAYGTESLFSSRIGATYTFSSDISGGYNIDVWWTARTSRCTAVPIKIYDGSVLLETVYADQTQDAGQWNYLGIYEFSDKARVVIESESTTCTTCADAVQFRK